MDLNKECIHLPGYHVKYIKPPRVSTENRE